MTTPTRARPVRRFLTAWPVWSGYAAAVWSACYGLLGLLWTLGVPGYPFGEGDLPDARAESLLGGTTAAGGGPAIAAAGLAGAGLALLLARTNVQGAARTALTALGGGYAITLMVLIQDQRPLMTIAYLPAVLLGGPFGWPLPFGEAIGKLLPWASVNLLLCVLGGLLWLAATVAFRRRGRNACGNCGRADGVRAGWTMPSAAARWGRWAAYLAAAIPFMYAVIRWAWAFGYPVGISEDFLRELHDNGLVWAGAYLGTFGAVGGILTLGLSQRWGEIWPRWIPGLAGKPVPLALPITAATIVTLALLPMFSMVARTADWANPGEMLANPMTFWPLWGFCLGAATLAYYFRTRQACQVCRRDDQPSWA